MKVSPTDNPPISADAKEVRRLVEEYCSKQRHPSLPEFTIHGHHTLESWWQTPFSAKAGCYAIYGQDGVLLYIGKASLNASTGSRLAAHLRHISPAWAQNPPHYVDIIEVSEAFEAPSLEEFLLMKIKTLYNGLGKRR